MYRFYILLGLAAFLVFCLAVLTGSLFGEKKRRRRIESAVEEHLDKQDTVCSPEVKEMVSLYLTMVAKHGPDSEEAKAFRFGTDSSLMRQLHDDDLSMKVFNERADVIDEMCRRMVKRRRKSGRPSAVDG